MTGSLITFFACFSKRHLSLLGIPIVFIDACWITYAQMIEVEQQ